MSLPNAYRSKLWFLTWGFRFKRGFTVMENETIKVQHFCVNLFYLDHKVMIGNSYIQNRFI